MAGMSLLFEKNNRKIEKDIPKLVYDQFEGITWYVQRVMNELYAETNIGSICSKGMVESALDAILTANSFTYDFILFQLPTKQKELLMAICKAGKAKQITSADFINKYHLPSASSVQSAIRGLLEKEFVTNNLGVYEVYDKFFALWLRKMM